MHPTNHHSIYFAFFFFSNLTLLVLSTGPGFSLCIHHPQLKQRHGFTFFFYFFFFYFFFFLEKLSLTSLSLIFLDTNNIPIFFFSMCCNYCAGPDGDCMCNCPTCKGCSSCNGDNDSFMGFEEFTQVHTMFPRGPVVLRDRYICTSCQKPASADDTKCQWCGGSIIGVN